MLRVQPTLPALSRAAQGRGEEAREAPQGQEEQEEVGAEPWLRCSPDLAPARRDASPWDRSGYTDYGRVWIEFLDRVVDDLDPRSTVIVLGDARTNGREPHAPAFGHIADRAGRTFWMNPEPKLYWNYGDSVMQVYEPYCTGVFECWTTKQLEGFVNAIADLRPVASSA